MPSNLKSDSEKKSVSTCFPRELPKDWIPDERASQTEQVFTGSCKPSCVATSRLILNPETNGMSFKLCRINPACCVFVGSVSQVHLEGEVSSSKVSEDGLGLFLLGLHSTRHSSSAGLGLVGNASEL